MENVLKSAEKIDSRHIRMARAGIGLTIRELASLSNTNKATIVRIESGQSVREATLYVIRKTLEDHGARFYECNNSENVAVKIINSDVEDKQ